MYYICGFHLDRPAYVYGTRRYDYLLIVINNHFPPHTFGSLELAESVLIKMKNDPYYKISSLSIMNDDEYIIFLMMNS